jgi:putative oxidoreductase
MKKLLATSNDMTLTLMRLVLGVLFFAHGAQKMLGWFGGFGFSATMSMFTSALHIPAPFAFLAIAAEFFGGLGLILGLLARVAALGIAVNMVVAIFMVHLQGVEYHLLALALAIPIVIRGAGAFSADGALAAKAS